MKNKNTLIFLGILPFLVGGCTLPFFNKPDEEQKEQEQDMIPEEPENREDVAPEYWGDEMDDFLPNVGETKLLFRHSKKETVGDDGEDYFYNYCPSIKIENNKEHVYYCTNKTWGNVTDHIGYRSAEIKDGKVQYSDESIVLSPTPETWDQTHTCDPTVIKGEFKYNGETYNYLMAYLGCIPLNCKLNETGLAVAKEYGGPWIKCNGLKTDGVTPINPIVPYSDFNCNENNWGTGQACLVSVDKKGRVLLFTTVSCPTGGFTDVREYDFSDINDYKLIRETKLFKDGGTEYGTNWIGNAEYCYDHINKKFLLSKPRGGYGSDGEYPDFIADHIDVYYVDVSSYENPFDIFFDSERTERWHFFATIDQKLSGYPRNHNNGMVTDEYGHLYRDGYIGVAFTSSQYGTMAAMTYLKTYRIFLTTFKLPYVEE